MTDLTNILTQRLIHSPLMYCWCVLAAHQHDNPFVQTERGHHGRELYIIWVHSSLKERIRHVNLCPDRTFSTVGQDCLDSRQWVMVGYRVVIQSPIAIYPSW